MVDCANPNGILPISPRPSNLESSRFKRICVEICNAASVAANSEIPHRLQEMFVNYNACGILAASAERWRFLVLNVKAKTKPLRGIASFF